MTPSMRRLERQLVDALKSQVSGKADIPVPEAGVLLWHLFLELSGNRSIGSVGANPLQWQDMLAWCQLRGWPLSQDHIEILLVMDAAFLDALHNRSNEPVLPEATPAAIDALFNRLEA